MSHARLIHKFETKIDQLMLATEQDTGHRNNTIQRKLRTVPDESG